MDRRLWFWGSLGLSVAASALLWWLGVPGFFLFLFLPFLFFPAQRAKGPGACKACGATPPEGAAFCPRCGAAL